MGEVIAACATAAGLAAIGVVRLSGQGCAEVVGQVFTPQRGGAVSALPERRLCLGTLKGRDGRLLDQCLCVYSRAPHTYTGEDTVELHCHGSPAVLAAALEALFAAGARQALPGEFTRRAFLNGRMDLTQAEAVIDLIEAETAEAAANAALQVGGALRQKIEAVYERLLALPAHFHAVIDYPDEDIEPFELTHYAPELQGALDELHALRDSYARGQVLKEGVRAVILGKPNVGKSSLLNALAGFERVIVTPRAGTTRDTVEHTVRLGGVLLRLTDTAGIHDTGDEIEQLGVARSLAAAKEAQLALFVCDGSQPLDEEDLRAIAAAQAAPCAIGLINKTDLPAVVHELPFETVISLSAATGEGLQQLEDFVAARFGASGSVDGSLVTNARQAGALDRAIAALRDTLQALQAGLTPDAALTDLERALGALGELTGRVVREDVVAQIFSRFCVGK